MASIFTPPRKTYRVVQWATGNIGLRALRCVIEHPQLDLVGVFVYSDAKAGRDAGELCGLAPVGVKATRSIDDILAARPDCVLYMPQFVDLDDLCRLLEAGINIVTTRTEFHPGGKIPAEGLARVEAACQIGGSSLHSTGSSPGFTTDALSVVLLSLQRRLDHLHIHEFADLAPRNSPQILFDIIGFGRAPNPTADEARAQRLRLSFVPSLAMVARAIGLPFDEIRTRGEVALARNTARIAAGVVEAGTVAAQRATVEGLRSGKPIMSFSATWFCSRDIDADWLLRDDGWSVTVDGDTPLDVQIRFPVARERWPEVSPGLTAHRPVNAVPFVCEAEPGTRTALDLPQIIAALGP
jgi:2,4-diaminopentanoate dehydrogenase